VLITVFTSSNSTEVELVRARLVGAGFHPSVAGAQQLAGFFPGITELISEVRVPDSELERARVYLLDSKLKLDETLPSGEIAEGSVCPVHEKPAVATCDRCGTFLCAGCGSLGQPPLCEDCVVRSDAPRPRPYWVTLTARLWAVWWIGSFLIAGLIGLALLGRRLIPG
jgi:hypothetical protein